METYSFGHWLRLKRKALDLTREGLADRVGYSAETIRKIETEERRPSAQLVDQLAELLEIPENQRRDFRRFARGDWQAAPSGNVESSPWLVIRSREQDDPLKSKIHLATFLFTDIEGSSKLWEHEPEKMKVALQRHHEILQEAIASNGGEVFQIIGDAFCAAFLTVLSAVTAALTAQQELHQEQWDLPFPIRVRMGIHTGEAERKLDGDYASGPTLNRVARILAAGHGGQVLLSLVTKDLVKDSLPANTELRDMGEHYLKNLMYPEHLFQLTIAGLRSEFPSLNTLTQRHNLPAQLTTFIGRGEEIAEIKKALESHRLLTLTGPGGIGKTRLSQQVAANLIEAFPDGVWFVELAPLTDPDLIPQTIHTTLGLVEQPGKNIQQMLMDYLREKKALLILDNCEHLVEACAQLTHTLLGHSPSLKILASSREALGVEGEVAWQVPSLSLPDPRKIPDLDQLAQYEAVHLFLDRASLANPRFLMTEDNAPAIAQICYRLDGIPLAIELAAARVRGMSVEQIASRLDDRFHLLTSGARTVLPRHQTLHALIDWSHDLLSESERALLRRLSVFAGGWTLEAAESVCAGDGLGSDQILDLLLRLVDKSLVVAETQGIEPRYHMLETIRQYTDEKLLELGGRESIRDTHLAYFVMLVERAEPELYRSNQVFWFKKLDDELDNFRKAVDWALATDVAAGLRILAISWRFWQRHNYLQELGDWLRKLLERYPEHDSLRAQALVAFSIFIMRSGDLVEARKAVEQGLQLARSVADRQTEALSLLYLGSTFQDEHQQQGIPFLKQSLALYRTLEDKMGQAAALFWLSLIFGRNDWEDPKPVLFESLQLHRDLGNLTGIADCLDELATLPIWAGDFSSPLPWLEEARKIFHDLGNQSDEADVVNKLGTMAYGKGDYQQARAYFEEALALYGSVGVWWSIYASVGLAYMDLRQGHIEKARAGFEKVIRQAYKENHIDVLVWAAEGIASLQVNQTEFECAARLFAWVDAMREKLASRAFIEQKFYERDLAVIHTKLDEVDFAKFSQEGRTMTLEQAVALALQPV